MRLLYISNKMAEIQAVINKYFKCGFGDLDFINNSPNTRDFMGMVHRVVEEYPEQILVIVDPGIGIYDAPNTPLLLTVNDYLLKFNAPVKFTKTPFYAHNLPDNVFTIEK